MDRSALVSSLKAVHPIERGRVPPTSLKGYALRIPPIQHVRTDCDSRHRKEKKHFLFCTFESRGSTAPVSCTRFSAGVDI